MLEGRGSLQKLGGGRPPRRRAGAAPSGTRQRASANRGMPGWEDSRPLERKRRPHRAGAYQGGGAAEREARSGQRGSGADLREQHFQNRQGDAAERRVPQFLRNGNAAPAGVSRKADAARTRNMASGAAASRRLSGTRPPHRPSPRPQDLEQDGLKGRKKNFVVQGSLLAAAGIVVRLIGMVYRIPLTAIIGTEGNGYYTSAFSIYSLLLILSSYSMPTAVSKIVSGHLAGGRYKNTERVLRASFAYATGIGALMCMILYFGAESIAEMLQKPYCMYALQALAPTVWIMAYLGILRGYFQGMGNMVPTAISQILEQILNAVVSVLAAGMLFHRGELSNRLYADTEYSYAFGAAGGCLGTGAGALIALLFFLVLFMSQYPVLRRRALRDQHPSLPYGQIAAVLAATMLPILLSSTIYNISNVVDDYIFGNMMAQLGMAQNIVKEWGVYGEYHILFNIPVALANALSSSLIPSLTRAVEERNRQDTITNVRYSIRFTMLITIPATAGLLVLADPICRMLFPGESVELLVNLTRAGALAVVFYSLSTISNAILQGLGRLHVPLRNALISLVLHIGALIGFLFLRLGIYAIVLSNMVFALLMCVLNQFSIRKYANYRQEMGKIYGYPAFASLFMGGAAYLVYRLLQFILPASLREGRLGCALSLCPAILVALFVYFGIMIFLHAFTPEDLDHMPLGGRLKPFVRS